MDSQYKYILLHHLFLADFLLDNTFMFTDSTKSEMDKHNVKGFLTSFVGLYTFGNFKLYYFGGTKIRFSQQCYKYKAKSLK